MAQKKRAEIRRAVHSRIRRKVRGTADRPRLAVYRTLASASTSEKAFGGKTGGNIEAAKNVGKAIAERAIGAGISSVVYDRGGYVYHGRVKALLDATREAGLNKGEVETGGEEAAAQ
jgi:large subunit ribosomal protein L18